MSKILQTVGINDHINSSIPGKIESSSAKFENFEKLVWPMSLYYIASRYPRLNGCAKVSKILTFVNRFPWNSIKKSIIYNTPGMSFPPYIANNHYISLAFSLIYFSDMKPVWSGLIIISSIFLILWAWTLFTCIMMLIRKIFSVLYVK